MRLKTPKVMVPENSAGRLEHRDLLAVHFTIDPHQKEVTSFWVGRPRPHTSEFRDL